LKDLEALLPGEHGLSSEGGRPNRSVGYFSFLAIQRLEAELPGYTIVVAIAGE
jgi:hypothetical protein